MPLDIICATLLCLSLRLSWTQLWKGEHNETTNHTKRG